MVGLSPISSSFYYYDIYGLLHKKRTNTPPQAGVYTSYMLSLLQMNYIWDLPSGLVNKSASWLTEDTYFGSIIPSSFLRTTWHIISICFVLSWITWFCTKKLTDLLSQYWVISLGCKTYLGHNLVSTQAHMQDQL